MAELIRRQRGGAAVVLGALSPRTRNAQAELYESGEVDYLVATDAIGMGLNMDIDHVALAGLRKFDGLRQRDLSAQEVAQIAGRAGRHIRDGTFGETADCSTISDDFVEAIEEHQFSPLKALQWRTEEIDLSSVEALIRSLEAPSPRPELLRSKQEDDETALFRLSRDEDLLQLANTEKMTALLWEVCQIPDFRKISPENHASLLSELYFLLAKDGMITDAFLEPVSVGWIVPMEILIHFPLESHTFGLGLFYPIAHPGSRMLIIGKSARAR